MTWDELLTSPSGYLSWLSCLCTSRDLQVYGGGLDVIGYVKVQLDGILLRNNSCLQQTSSPTSVCVVGGGGMSFTSGLITTTSAYLEGNWAKSSAYARGGAIYLTNDASLKLGGIVVPYTAAETTVTAAYQTVYNHTGTSSVIQPTRAPTTVRILSCTPV